MTNRITILGCGPSAGVPLTGHSEGPFWGSCDPHNPKNRRSRTSAFVEYQGGRFLIDASPDLRQQLLENHIYDLDALLITHTHADHVHGIDDLRPIVFVQKKKTLPVYGTSITIHNMMRTFPYLFREGVPGIYPPILEPRELKGETLFGSIRFQAFSQDHGTMISTGFRFGNMAYSTDFMHLDNDALSALHGIELWIVDCLGRSPKPTHNHLELTLDWINLVKPDRAVLIHMNQEMDYETLVNELPSGVEPAYDGMVLEF